MSVTAPRNISVYIIMVTLFGGGTIYNSINVDNNQSVTIDKINAMLDRIEKLEVAHGIDVTAGSEHDSLFAHPGIFERTNAMQSIIDDLQDRILYLERNLNTGVKP